MEDWFNLRADFIYKVLWPFLLCSDFNFSLDSEI